MAIEKISENKRKQIVNKSVNPLPNNPSKAGYKADEIKKAMFNFVTDEKDSVIDEINRVVDETNASFNDIDNTNQKTSKTIESINNNIKQLNDALSDKVDKEEGKQLSSNDFSSEEKEKLARLTNYDDSEVRAGINEINSKIPAQASSINQLADKDFVNSSIETATATFKGTFEDLDLLKATSADKNDYAFYDHISNSNRVFDRYKHNGTEWVYEYTLNNSSFTDAQWKAINSGATAELINKILTNADNINTILNTLNNIDTRLNNAVDKSSPQDISGLKNFTERPTVNNKEVALKTDIAESSGTTVFVKGDPVTEFNADDKLDKTANAVSATEATQDSDGNIIKNTYTKLDGSNDYIILTQPSDNNNVAGWRLVSTYTLSKWSHANLLLAIYSRHSGTGLLSIGICDTNGSIGTVDGSIRFYGSTDATMYTNAWKMIYNTTTGVVKVYWRYTDYNSCRIKVLHRQNFSQVSNGNWLTTEPVAGENEIEYLPIVYDKEYVKKVDGKDLSSNDFTEALLTKLNGIADGATKNTTTRNITLNGGAALPVYATGATNASWYAPTTVGSANQILKSNGSGAPAWINQSEITAGNASKVEKGLTFQNSASATDTFNGSGAKSLIGKVVDMFSKQTVAGEKTFSNAPRTSATLDDNLDNTILATTNWVRRRTGDWVTTNKTLASSLSTSYTTILTSSIIDDYKDGATYEVMLNIYADNTTSSTSANSEVYVESDIITPADPVLDMRAASSRKYVMRTVLTMPVKRSFRYKTVTVDNCSINMIGYRRIG